MQIVVRGPAEDRAVDVRVERPDVVVDDLVAALAAHGLAPDEAVTIDGRVVDGDLGLDEAGLVMGSVVANVAGVRDIDPGDVAAVPQPSPDAVDIVVSGGPVSGGRRRLGVDPCVIGRGDADMALGDPTVSPAHLRVVVTSTGARVEDLGSFNGSRVDGEAVRGPVDVGPAALLELGASQLELRSVAVDDRPFGLDPAVGATAGSLAFNRPPRRGLPAGPTDIEVPDAPRERQGSRTASVLTLLGPVVMGIVMVKVMGNIRFALFALMSPLMFVTNLVAQKRRDRVENRNSVRAFKAGLATFRDQLTVAADRERRRLEEVLPDPAEILRRAYLPSTRLWERRSHHSDTLWLRVGRGPRPWEPPVDSGRVRAHPDLIAAVDVHRCIDRCPVDVDLADGGVVGLVGDRTAALALARSLVFQAAVLHGPADLPMAVLTDRLRAGDWDWAKWLPHVREADGDGRRLSSDAETSAAMMTALLEAADPPDRTVAGRAEPRPPALLVVVDDETLTVGRRSPTRAVLRGRGGPVAGIVLASSIDRLPSVCSSVVVLHDDLGDAELLRPQRAERVEQVVIAGVSDAAARDTARALARYEDPEIESRGAGIPARVRLLPLLGLDDVDADAIVERWGRAGIDPAPRAPIGVGEDGVIEVDLVADGPHGLVGGTTGSGKSEFLRSLVAGMAANAGPEHLVFVLVDYKGGSAFDQCARLPHAVGLVTDLDEHLGERALRSLEAELHRREHQLRGAGAADLAEYLHAGAPAGPMPRLVVVVDEFATMAAELPDFMGALVGVAQRGRSLGVHLVLATQRPSGAVNANIKANTNLRVALRVQDQADSIDVIDRPDAADISRRQPGRAHVRLGPADVVPVQTALATATAPATGHAPVAVRPFRFGPSPSAGVSTPRVDEPEVDTDLVRLVDACVEAFEASGRPLPQRPWLEMLPEDLRLAELGALEPERSGAVGPSIPIGLVDDPDRQRQTVLSWCPADGHLGLLGAVGSGTTTAAVTAVLSASSVLDPASLHVYGLDFGGGGLAALAGLPHVGAIVGAAERERQVRLVRHVRREVERRRALTGPERALEPRILLVVDDAAAFLADFDDVDGAETADAFKRIVAEGADLGVAVILTARRPMALNVRIMSSVTRRLLFKLADPSDFAFIGVRQGCLPAFVPGRAVDGESSAVVQVARVPDVDAVVADIAARQVAAGPVAPPILTLPGVVRRRDLVDAMVEDGAIRVPLGLAEDGLDTAWLELHPGDHLFVGGGPRSGVSTTLELVARSLRGVDSAAVLVAVAGERSPLRRTDGVFDAVGSLEELAPVLELAAVDDGRSWVVVVDDAHLLDEVEALDVLLRNRANPRCRLVVGGRSDLLHGVFSHWTRSVRKAGRGVLLQPRLDADGDLLGVRLPRRIPVPLVPGRGFLVADGASTLLQVAGVELAA